ncbi:MAG: GNAT family N-acetyltransferase [Crocinitomicaceae bacterium]|nr:GNAT family N-acetyltransferase [Crocinitomicaceae bacterium]
MSFQLIERKDLDAQKWDNLVDQTEGVSVFTSSFYLDAVAENWCVVVNDDYSAGLALPYTIRARRKILYTPIFASYLEVLGSVDPSLFKEIILKNFKTIEIEFRQDVLGSASDVFVTQFLNTDKKRKGQVNRMLNKSKRAGYEVQSTENWEPVFEILYTQLNGKFTGMTDVSLQRLKQAYSNAQEAGLLRTFEIVGEETCLGGVICIEKNGQLLYSKGACSVEVRDQGGMYAAMDAAISYANANELTFDFGGSRVEGVRRFNHAFGGEDLEYFSYRIDKSPRWFRWVRRLKKRWGKKS